MCGIPKGGHRQHWFTKCRHLQKLGYKIKYNVTKGTREKEKQTKAEICKKKDDNNDKNYAALIEVEKK